MTNRKRCILHHYIVLKYEPVHTTLLYHIEVYVNVYIPDMTKVIFII